MSSITELTTAEDFTAHVSALPPATLLIVSFHAPWAAPCTQMSAVLSTLASEYPVTDPLSTSWVSINAEDLSDISEAYNVTAVPFIALIRNGNTVETVSGSSAVKVRAVIENHAPRPTSQPPRDHGSVKPATMPETPPHSVVNTGMPDPATSSKESVLPHPQGLDGLENPLFKRLADLVRAAPVMLFMKGTPGDPKCGFSREMVNILRAQAVKYGFFNILADDEVRQGLKQFADWPTYPQLWVDGELVGGLDIVSPHLILKIYSSLFINGQSHSQFTPPARETDTTIFRQVCTNNITAG